MSKDINEARVEGGKIYVNGWARWIVALLVSGFCFFYMQDQNSFRANSEARDARLEIQVDSYVKESKSEREEMKKMIFHNQLTIAEFRSMNQKIDFVMEDVAELKSLFKRSVPSAGK